jgi:hypothetical protein
VPQVWPFDGFDFRRRRAPPLEDADLDMGALANPKCGDLQDWSIAGVTVYEDQASAAQASEFGADIRIHLDEQTRIQRNRARHMSEVIQHVHGAQGYRREYQRIACFGQALGDAQCVERIGACRRMESVRFDSADRHEHDAVCLNLLVYRLPWQEIQAV